MTRGKTSVLLAGLLLALVACLFPPWSAFFVSDVDFGVWTEGRGRHFILARDRTCDQLAAAAFKCGVDRFRLAQELSATGLGTALALAAMTWWAKRRRV